MRYYIGKVDGLRSSQIIELGGLVEILVLKHNGKVYASQKECIHAGASLARGIIRDHCLVCPAHGWAFNLETGIDETGQAEPLEKQVMFPVSMEGDDVYVDF
ncbi:Rieske (2Fe-2S) protein [Aneurinibacillus tyrosinisolvens]|uniref:Rieske (2Fe-2S) protein n=1 Tax=Aneurinibacillus tyrosinisolvens TaxID=1443435 RepID=UPI00069AB530|nr:Rieske 2Fe-2S domain-containing protein [Aneurinibacillus tyrosinisolvens]